MNDLSGDGLGDGGEPANLRFLRRLVTTLTATMILGVLIIIALLVIRLQSVPGLVLPDQITLPGGVTAQAFTQGAGWFAVVAGDEILIYGADGDLRDRVAVDLNR